MPILFDLDGTLTDPFPGITRCIQYALESLERPVPDANDLRWCIGPPLAQSFATLLGPDHVFQSIDEIKNNISTNLKHDQTAEHLVDHLA